MSGPSHNNCFDVLRFALAIVVVYSHAYFLLGVPEPSHALVKSQTILGTVAVLGFFGISGYLVAASWDRSRGLGSFLRKRALRIFPGFIAALVVVALVIAPAIHLAKGRDLAKFPTDEALSFIASNGLLRVNQWTVGDTLSGNPYEGSIMAVSGRSFQSSCATLEPPHWGCSPWED